jgi:hypothetical protein
MGDGSRTIHILVALQDMLRMLSKNSKMMNFLTSSGDLPLLISLAWVEMKCYILRVYHLSRKKQSTRQEKSRCSLILLSVGFRLFVLITCADFLAQSCLNPTGSL